MCLDSRLTSQTFSSSILAVDFFKPPPVTHFSQMAIKSFAQERIWVDSYAANVCKLFQIVSQARSKCVHLFGKGELLEAIRHGPVYAFVPTAARKDVVEYAGFGLIGIMKFMPIHMEVNENMVDTDATISNVPVPERGKHSLALTYTSGIGLLFCWFN